MLRVRCRTTVGTVRNDSVVALSNRTITFLAEVFYGGTGPTHREIQFIWDLNGAGAYLPPEEEATKRDRVLYGLRHLRDGRASDGARADLAQDEDRLHLVAGELAAKIIEDDPAQEDAVREALANDGFALDGDRLVAEAPSDDLADELAGEVLRLFGDRDDMAVARNHLEQAERNFAAGDWEAANSQYRSAYDATYDTLAHARGCPATRTGGSARKWLQDNGHLDEDEADLMREFATFAGRNGSHAGISDAVDSQLRRHMATAVIRFGIAKLG
jgi:hypothetical protein